MLFAQDGYARTDKIKKGLRNGLLEGAIFCPCYSTPARFERDIREYFDEFPEKKFFMDPHFYVSLMSANKIGRLSEYPFFKENLTKRDFSARNIINYVKENLDYQNNLNFKNILSPGVLIENFNGINAQLTLQIFRESEEYFDSVNNDKKLFLSLIILESALSDPESLNEFLDEITRLKVDGFYIIVQRSLNEFPQWTDSLLLAKLLYIIYSLDQNDYIVYAGYTDLVGLLFSAAGTKGFANGWWLNLKQLTRDKFIQRETGGGRKPKATYTSNKLLNSININPELISINEIEKLESILSLTSVDNIFRERPIEEWETFWDKDIEAMQHWEAIKKILEEIDRLNSFEEKLTIIDSKIDSAIALYIDLNNDGIIFGNRGKPRHLYIWKKALNIFKEEL